MRDDDAPDLRSVQGIDTTKANSARIWDYLLGGQENYPVDRELAAEVAEFLPDIAEQAKADRLFLSRVIGFLAGEAGITQFLDIGTGLPTANNTHEVAQRANPSCRVVYVDNDQLVLAHARALLTSTPEGRTAYVDADMHDPDHILDRAEETLELSRPVAITMLGVFWHILDDAEASRIMERLLARVPSGSYLAVSQQTLEITGEKAAEAVRLWNERGSPPGVWRTPRQIEELFLGQGLEIIEPGVVTCTRWRPETAAFDLPETDQFAAVGRKP
ncbi:SAM-dependent methyltransferase [Actinomadura graeca]|uniref:SAM-dependent methyltransferase n=1 Tax=Actinomadura graeca TaxID=2750812 RepID=A0ABX8R080_9ACTN|nr:SAM-dependent methyltransferase [Actinomadura graeca]QXJ23377.1 SAM-dependent methyltransferase [Actinomadura graeca]